MKHIWAVIGVLFILFIFGCTQLITKDCGSDSECFEDALILCSKAKVTFTEQDPIATYTWASEIIGKSGTDCTVSVQFDGKLKEKLPFINKEEFSCKGTWTYNLVEETIKDIKFEDTGEDNDLCDFFESSVGIFNDIIEN